MTLVVCKSSSSACAWLQLWAASVMSTTDSRTHDGGSIVGTSVFYSDVAQDDVTSSQRPVTDEVERLNQELQVRYALQ